MGFFKIKSLQKLRMGIGFCSKVQISWGEHFCELDGILPALAFGFLRFSTLWLAHYLERQKTTRTGKRIPEELLSEKKSRKQKYQNMRRIFNSC